MRELLPRLAGIAAYAGLALIAPAAPSAHAADIYLVYPGKDRAQMIRISAMIPASWGVRRYNIDLLALADYTGTQKVAAKMARADSVVFVNARAGKPFDEHLFIADDTTILSDDGYTAQIEQLIGRLTQP